MPQGRSKESRYRVAKQKEALLKKLIDTDAVLVFKVSDICFYFEKSNVNEDFARCHSCLSLDVIFCPCEGELVCSNCGLVQDQIFSDISYETSKPFLGKVSKKYDRSVHFRERTAAWNNTGPMIPDEDWMKIEEAFYDLDHPKKHLLGKKLFNQICNEAGFKEKKYGERWIQARLRLGLEPPDWQPPEPELIKEMHQRFFLVNKAFQNTIHKDTDDQGVVPYCFKRRNIINLNYIILQLLRLIDEFEFQYWQKYFDLSTKNSLKLFNYYWRVMIEWINENQKNYYDSKNEQIFRFDWTYIKLRKSDLIKNNYFI